MKASVKSTLLVVALAAAALSALAQPGPGPAAGPGAGTGSGPGIGQNEPERRARMQERAGQHLAQRAAVLKAKLKLSAAQEGAWQDYVAAMKPPANPPLPSRTEIAKLSTPERLDKMRELRQQREAEFDRRDAATRTFYGTLSDEQKKIFDDNTGRPFREGRPWGAR